MDSIHFPHFFCYSIAKRNLDPCARKHMDPEPLSIAQSVICALDLREHDLSLRFAGFCGLILWCLFSAPQNQIRNASAALPVFLSHHLAYCRKSTAFEAFHKLHKIVNLEIPVEAHNTCPLLVLSIPDFTNQPWRLSVGNFNKPVVDFRCPRWVEGVLKLFADTSHLAWLGGTIAGREVQRATDALAGVL
ncbi:hypothetical protein HG530_003181 [Fusarium avenaceum]|nr:hypothetical protein HG530_003181 [Fusarium avenaceum]